jgi:hypothetical protein
MDNEHMRTIEIEGHKLEVDLRTAKTIEAYKVGDKVKVLTKNYSGWQTHPGILVGIDAFKNLPTVVIAYIESVFSSTGEVKFAYLNAESKETEMCPMSEDDIMPNRATIIDFFDKSINQKQAEVDAIVARKEYFLRQYGVAFGVGAEEVAEATA